MKVAWCWGELISPFVLHYHHHLSAVVSHVTATILSGIQYGTKGLRENAELRRRGCACDALGTLLIVADRIFSNILLKGHSIKQCSVIYQLKEAWTNKTTSWACPSL